MRAFFTFFFQLLKLFTLLLLFTSAVYAQKNCQRIGKVMSTSADCGVKIRDLENEELVLAVSGADKFAVGTVIHFDAMQAALPAGCVYAGQAFALTCATDTLPVPCKAEFSYTVDKLNAMRLSFQAELYDPANQSCKWDFGDGATATGTLVHHTFPREGYYKVWLEVRDKSNAVSKKCRTIYVSEENPNWCAHDVQITATATHVFGKVEPIAGTSQQLVDVKWTLQRTGELLGQGPKFSHTIPGEGTYFICAQYTTKSIDDNTECSSLRCQPVTVADNSCVNPQLINTAVLSSNIYSPVCGCDGLTYANDAKARAAGVTAWWAGACNSGAGSCGADMTFDILSGDPDNGFNVLFKNLSSGNFTALQLDFGDGTLPYFGTKWDTITHYYRRSGVYQTNMTVWQGEQCVSSMTRLLVSDYYQAKLKRQAGPPDYVMPGDANGDDKANVYDLLAIGIGHNYSGPPRPFATTEWTPQFAPNWSDTMPGAVNFKHLDCDGNGEIDEFDADAIEQNYAPIDTFHLNPDNTLPAVWVKFAADTVKLNLNNVSGYTEIDAEIFLGSVARPVIGLHGLAFALTYPEYILHDPQADYDDASFFGFSNHMMWLPKDNFNRRQLDLGFVRKKHQEASGYGRIARMKMRVDNVIIIDVIARSSAGHSPMTLPVTGLIGVNAKGAPLALTTTQTLDTLWFVTGATAVHTIPGEEKTLLFPNPAVTETNFYSAELPVYEAELFNLLGQRMFHQNLNPNDRMHKLDLQNCVPGLYTLRVRTDAGWMERKLAVRR